MPRRKRKPLTESQIKEMKREHKNYQSRKAYALKQSELFFNEYEEICIKYGCYIGSLSGAFVKKQERGEKIYTIKGHLGTLRRNLRTTN